MLNCKAIYIKPLFCVPVNTNRHSPVLIFSQDPARSGFLRFSPLPADAPRAHAPAAAFILYLLVVLLFRKFSLLNGLPDGTEDVDIAFRSCYTVPRGERGCPGARCFREIYENSSCPSHFDVISYCCYSGGPLSAPRCAGYDRP